MLDLLVESHTGHDGTHISNLTAPKFLPVLVTLLTPDGLVQASFSPSFSSSLSPCWPHLPPAPGVRFVPSSETEMDRKDPQVLCRYRRHRRRRRRRRLERLPVEASMTIPSMATPSTGTVNAHRAFSLCSSATPFSALDLTCLHTWCNVQKTFHGSAAQPTLSSLSHPPPGCCLAQTPKACRPLLRLFIPFPHFEFRYPPVHRIRKLPLFP